MAANTGILGQSHKEHRSRQSGPSANKKAKAKKKKQDISDENKQNPKVCLVSFVIIMIWSGYIPYIDRLLY